jgi:hypothetical protein
VIHPPAWFREYLAPAPFAGETLRFDLSAFLSRVTREMLQARLRRTPQAFGVSARPLAANVTPDETALEVDASALMAANAVVTERLAEGPAGAVDALRRLVASAVCLDAAARRFASVVSGGRCPSPAALLAYLDASARDQALGALKFCSPGDLKPRLASWFSEEPDLLEALLSPASRSLWSWLKAQELALAASRLRGPGSAYFARLHRFRRAWGYLHGEDVDFRALESEAVIDARATELGAQGAEEVTAQQRRLREALRTDQMRKLRARRMFAERLAAGAGGDRAARLVSHVLLVRALAAHEDHNRLRKMRLLRDLRDLAELAHLRIETATLRDLAAACGAFVGEDPLLASATS